MRLSLPAMLGRVLICVSLSLLLFTKPAAPTQAQSSSVIVARVTIKSSEAMNRFVRLGLDVLETRDGDDLFVAVSLQQFNELQNQGWQIKVETEQTRLLSQLTPNTFQGGYHTVGEIRQMLESKAAQFPNLAEFFIYGQSWKKINSGGALGEDLFGIRLTNRQISGNKPVLLLHAAIHARELTTAELAWRFVDYLLTNYGVNGDVTWLLDEHQIVIIPQGNPDGRALAEQGYYQRKNVNDSYGGNCSNPPTVFDQFGVDLNRNNSFKWGVVNTPGEDKCGQTYPGPSAASEPETAAFHTLVRSLFPDQRGPLDTDPAPSTATGIMLSLHSYGNLVLWPWGWTANQSPNYPDLSRIGGKFGAYTGFTSQPSSQLYPSSGSTTDWLYGELGVASFTFEVGSDQGTCGGFFPPYSCLDGNAEGNFWGRTLPAFLYAARIARTPYQLAQGPTAESVSTISLSNGAFEINAQLSEQFNGNQNIVAAEYYVDVPPWRGGIGLPMVANDGSFNSPLENAKASTSALSAGRHLVFVRAQDSLGNWGPVRAVFVDSAGRLHAAKSDFDGDGRTDFAVWRGMTGNWSILQSGDNALRNVVWGTSQSPDNDQPVPGDYDGDGKFDIAVWRSSTGEWLIANSGGGTQSFTLGSPGDVPVPADYDGDGKTDPAVWTGASGHWLIKRSSGGAIQTINWGTSAAPYFDLPVAGDYDGDGKADAAVWRQGDGKWYVLKSSTGQYQITAWGAAYSPYLDVPVPGDYDGDGKFDIAVWRRGNGTWFVLRSSDGTFRMMNWGAAQTPYNDVPVPGDYDGDGKYDIAVWRPLDGNWYVIKSSNGGWIIQNQGQNGDVPAPASGVR